MLEIGPGAGQATTPLGLAAEVRTLEYQQYLDPFLSYLAHLGASHPGFGVGDTLGFSEPISVAPLDMISIQSQSALPGI